MPSHAAAPTASGQHACPLHHWFTSCLAAYGGALPMPGALLSCWHSAMHCAVASGEWPHCLCCIASPWASKQSCSAHAHAGVRPRTGAAAATVGSLWRPQPAAPTSACRCAPRRAAAQRRTSGVSRQPVRQTLCRVSATAQAGSSGRRWAAGMAGNFLSGNSTWAVASLLAWAAGGLLSVSQRCGRQEGLSTWQ